MYKVQRDTSISNALWREVMLYSAQMCHIHDANCRILAMFL
jgi:hypothetical protein